MYAYMLLICPSCLLLGLRLMVECRYPRVSAAPMFAGPVLASAGYMVMSPSLPPFLVSEGRFGVQLLISLGEVQ